MKKFKIGKYWIEQLDERNWAIKHLRVVNLAKRTKTPLEGTQVSNTGTFGYYTTLQGAKEDLAELVAKTSKNFEELEKWIDKIKEIK